MNINTGLTESIVIESAAVSSPVEERGICGQWRDATQRLSGRWCVHPVGTCSGVGTTRTKHRLENVKILNYLTCIIFLLLAHGTQTNNTSFIAAYIALPVPLFC